MQQLDRIPNLYKGIGGGALYSFSSKAVNYFSIDCLPNDFLGLGKRIWGD
jgi:hypothetical protein